MRVSRRHGKRLWCHVHVPERALGAQKGREGTTEQKSRYRLALTPLPTTCPGPSLRSASSSKGGWSVPRMGSEASCPGQGSLARKRSEKYDAGTGENTTIIAHRGADYAQENKHPQMKS